MFDSFTGSKGSAVKDDVKRLSFPLISTDLYDSSYFLISGFITRLLTRRSFEMYIFNTAAAET